jgi:hypothetical protein
MFCARDCLSLEALPVTVLFIGCGQGKHSDSCLVGSVGTAVLTHARCTTLWFILHEPKTYWEIAAGHIGAPVVLTHARCTPCWYFLHVPKGVQPFVHFSHSITLLTGLHWSCCLAQGSESVQPSLLTWIWRPWRKVQ